MRIFKWIKPLRFLIALCVVNMVLSFMLEPARGSSGTMWEEYYREEELDTIFVGSSFCVASFNPYVFDEQLGVKSFNMGTPLQAIEQTISAVETALEDHDIKTVVIGTGFFVLQEGAYEKAELTFEKAKARKLGGIEGVVEGIRYVFADGVRDTEKSINYLFPWLYNQEEISSEFIVNNMRAKLAGEGNLGAQVSRKGYRCFEGVVDYETAWTINSYTYYGQALDFDLMEKFGELLEQCKKNGADVIVINSPHPTFDVISCYESYAENENLLKELCKEHAVEYYNFSLAKAEIFDAKPEFFYDFEHLNAEGADAFSKSMCELIKLRNVGEDVEQYFYSVEDFYSIHSDLLEEWNSLQMPR